MSFDPSSLVYNDQGLIPAIAQAESGEVMMMAWMNAEAVEKNARDGARHLLVSFSTSILGQGRVFRPYAGIDRFPCGL